MGNLNMKTTRTQLIINTMKRAKYNELCANSEIQYDQLYLVEDENLDAFNGRVVNVANPQISSDAVNKSFLETNYIKIGNLDRYIDTTKLYSANSNGDNYPSGTQYINSNLELFEKQTNPQWSIVVNKPTSLSPNDITIDYSGDEFGWRFNFNGTFRYGTNKTLLADVTKVEGDPDYDIVATRIWPKVDSYISKKQLYSCLSTITAASETSEIANAITSLNELLKNYAS